MKTSNIGPIFKSRLVVRGYEKIKKQQSDSPTVSKDSFRTLLALSATKNLEIPSSDVKAAFLQGSDIARDIYILQPKEAENENSLWKLRKVLYGLSDGSRNCFFSLKDELQESACEMSTIDPAVFRCVQNGSLTGLLLVHVDDIFGAVPKILKETLFREYGTSF